MNMYNIKISDDPVRVKQFVMSALWKEKLFSQKLFQQIVQKSNPFWWQNVAISYTLASPNMEYSKMWGSQISLGLILIQLNWEAKQKESMIF